jgi:protein gp37
MKLYVPSLARAAFIHGPNSTLTWIKGTALAHRTFYVVRSAEVAAYKQALAGTGARVLDDNGAKNIGATRAFIAETAQAAGEPKFMMADDDLQLLVRRSPDTQNLRRAEPADTEFLIAEMERLLDTYAQVAVSCREGNNWAGSGPCPLLRENTRAMRLYAFRTEEFLSVDAGRLGTLEDFDVTLQLLRAGKKNAVIYYYAQGQASTQSAGGCSRYRTVDNHDAACRQLQQLHPEFVTLRKKVSKTAQNGFGVRTEVTIQWQRAYASSAAAAANSGEKVDSASAVDVNGSGNVHSVGAHVAAADRHHAEERKPGWWWDLQWNPVGGCSPASPGCANCYAAVLADQYTWGLAPHKGVTANVRGRRVFTGKLTSAPPGHPVWSWPLTWPGAECPKLGPGAPSLIFCGDMSDVFHEDRPTDIIDRVVATAALSGHITLLLTKRTARMAEYFAEQSPRTVRHWRQKIWLGFSGERQKEFDERWADMLPLAEAGWLVFASIAPLIAPVTLPPDFLALGSQVWCIVAGEQGRPHSSCRDMHPSWARAIRDQCAAHGIPFFMKQMAKLKAIPPDLLIREFPQLNPHRDLKSTCRK